MPSIQMFSKILACSNALMYDGRIAFCALFFWLAIVDMMQAIFTRTNEISYQMDVVHKYSAVTDTHRPATLWLPIIHLSGVISK